MKYIGKFGEYQILAALLEQNIEAYPAIKTNQKDYDVTAILPNKEIVRIQVKSTNLQNKSTDNFIKGINKVYDILVIVAYVGNLESRYFIFKKLEALTLKGERKHLPVSHMKNKKSYIRENLLDFENKWQKITEFK